MIIDNKNEVCEAYVGADFIYTDKGEQLFFLNNCNGIYTKVTDFNYKKYPRSKKVFFENGIECSKTFENKEELEEWIEFLYNEVQIIL